MDEPVTQEEAARAKARARSAGERGADTRTQRVIFGALYAIINIVCLFAGKIPTAVLVAVMAFFSCLEFYHLAKMRGRNPNVVMGLVSAVLFPLMALFKSTAYTLAVALVLFIALGVWYVRTPLANITDVATTVFGALYTGLLLTCIVLIRREVTGTEGALLTLGAMASIWVGDAAAYAVGSAMGRHKMAPKISPNKTWEGAIGGLLGSVLVWLILVILHVRDMPLWVALLAGVVVNVCGVFGDLFESRIKRGSGVKDSGNLIPGHGGMLDRTDSLLFGVVAAYIILKMVDLI